MLGTEVLFFFEVLGSESVKTTMTLVVITL